MTGSIDWLIDRLSLLFANLVEEPGGEQGHAGGEAKEAEHQQDLPQVPLHPATVASAS